MVDRDQGTTSFLDAVCRVLWMMLGPILLAILAYLIIKTGNGWLTGADIGFLAVLAVMLAARWLEARGGNARTADGEPAGPEHLRRYLVIASVSGIAAWIAANIFANHW